eukprot:Selendium_serpulae@DN1808_c0_g1_i1.p1
MAGVQPGGSSLADAQAFVTAFFEMYPESDQHSVVTAFKINHAGAMPTDKPLHFRDHIRRNAASDAKLRRFLASLTEGLVAGSTGKKSAPAADSDKRRASMPSSVTIEDAENISNASNVVTSSASSAAHADAGRGQEVFSRSFLAARKGPSRSHVPKRSTTAGSPEFDFSFNISNDDPPRRGFCCDNKDRFVLAVNNVTVGVEECFALHTNMEDVSRAADASLEVLGPAIIAAHRSALKQSGAEELDIAAVGDTRQTPVVVVGRVGCDAEGKINSASLTLEGSRQTGGRLVQLYLSALPCFFLYPGQIVAAVGVFLADPPAGNAPGVPASYRLDSRPPEPPPSPGPGAAIAPRFNGHPVHTMVAAGPFSPPDSLSLENLDALLQQAKANKPHVLILLGPFVDKRNELIKCGDLLVRDEASKLRYLSYDELYSAISVKITTFCHSSPTTSVVLVPGIGDVCHPFALPQPPLPWALLKPSSGGDGDGAAEPVHPKNFRLASNPASLSLNSVKVDVASFEPLAAFSNMTRKGAMAPLAETFLNQIFAQRTWLPTTSHGLPVDPSRRAALHWLPGTPLPDVLLFASDWTDDKSAGLVKEAGNGRVCVNPGRIGGTEFKRPSFANLFIDPPLPGVSGPAHSASQIAKRTRVEIITL